MELDLHSNDARDLLPPRPLPKLNLESPLSTPELPPTPDYFGSRSSSQPPSPSRHPANSTSLLPPVNGTSEALLTPPSPNPAGDDSFLPSAPSSPSFKGKQSKKSNPLTDLVESEREYIDVLAGIIRKVAGAWSRTNFPPKQLDAMFRGIESVYKANRGLLTKLKEIGLSPSSPKALGDLLMRWIDDLDAPYTKYCANFATGFDDWEPVTSNPRLQPILAALSSVNPPPPVLQHQAGDADAGSSPIWTLDALFSLPRARLKYYKKLYTRLLKSTQAGRSDHKLLTGAVDKLENLLGILADRESILIGKREGEKRLDAQDTGDHSLPDGRAGNGFGRVASNVSGSETTEEQARRSVGSSIPHSSLSSETRASRDAEFSRAGGRTTSSATMSSPISDLERRLSTERTLDLFTLKPRAVRLQMNPASLPFTRGLRLSHNVEIHFTPRLTPNSRLVHTRGHIFLLTDLFLVCERMTSDERQEANSEADGQDYDMWLLYPPLAGKHLRVSAHPEQDNVLQILILKKETLLIHTESRATRDHFINEFKECIEAANLLSPRAGQPPPPPVPSLKKISQHPSDPVSPERDSQLNAHAGSSSSVSPVTVSSVNPSPQPSTQERPYGNSTESSRHGSFTMQPETQKTSTSPVARGTHLSMDTSPTSDPQGGMPHSSVSLPQISSSGLPASTHRSQQTAKMSTPYIPPPRGASATAPMAPPARPATAPGQPLSGGPSFQPNYPGQYPPRMQSAYPLHPGQYPNGQGVSQGRPPSDPMVNGGLRKSPSARSLGSQFPNDPPPPVPGYPSVHTQPQHGFPPRDGSVNFSTVSHVHQPHPRVPFPPPATFDQRGNSFATTSSWGPSIREPSPPNSPIDDEPIHQGPVTSTITAQFKCKIFLQLHHGQWKSLGGARLKLYLQQPTNVKQLVVEADTKDKAMLISTIVLTDGVERVGKTGVAIELSDKGARTGIVYMIQLRNETSASGLFDSLLAGSDRAAGRTGKG